MEWDHCRTDCELAGSTRIDDGSRKFQGGDSSLTVTCILVHGTAGPDRMALGGPAQRHTPNAPLHIPNAPLHIPNAPLHIRMTANGNKPGSLAWQPSRQSE